jgi:hypothetical protein
VDRRHEVPARHRLQHQGVALPGLSVASALSVCEALWLSFDRSRTYTMILFRTVVSGTR